MLSKSAKQLLRGYKKTAHVNAAAKVLSTQSGLPPPISAAPSFECFRNGVYKSDYSRLPMPNQDICSYLFPRWERLANRDALECVTTGRKMTYGQLLNASLRFGGALRNLNLNSEPDIERVSPNKEVTIPQRVSILSPNVIEYAPAFFGTIAAGCSITTINTNYKVAEIMHNLRDTKPQLLVVHPLWENIAEQALDNLKMNIPIMTIGQSSKQGRPNLQDVLNDSRIEKIIPQKTDPSNVAYILYSGGTTGLPKGVAVSHSAVTNNVDGFTDSRIFPFEFSVNSQQTVLGLMPFYHIYGFYVVMITQLFVGSKILVFKELDPSSFGRVIKKHKIQFLHLVPTLMNFVINSKEVTREDMSSVTGVFIASAPVLPSSAKALQEKIAHEITFQEGFGMTEILASHLTPHNSVRIGYCGKLLPDSEAKIVDLETKDLCGPGRKGELLIRGTGTMSHYLNNPKATSETIDEEGFLHTGDVAISTKDGYFSIVDRIKELIKVKDFQVSPAEIEDLLMSHPAVSEAGVVGIPDERMGELPRAYVSLKGQVTKDELLELVKSNLASYKALAGGIVFLDDLPKSQAGKILRKDLKSMAFEDVKKMKLKGA